MSRSEMLGIVCTVHYGCIIGLAPVQVAGLVVVGLRLPFCGNDAKIPPFGLHM